MYFFLFFNGALFQLHIQPYLSALPGGDGEAKCDNYKKKKKKKLTEGLKINYERSLFNFTHLLRCLFSYV